MADMFRDNIFGSDIGRFNFRNIGDYPAACTANGPQERSHETVESAQEFADPVPPLKVDRSRIDKTDPRRRGKNTTSLIDVVRL